MSVLVVLLLLMFQPSRAFAPMLARPQAMPPLLVASDNINNEWGIPYSSDLPPLSDTISNTLPNGAKVTLLGSGPGDPNLLTVSAYKMLTTADTTNTIVIADRLVSPEILSLIKCPLQVARKLPGCAELAQEEIYWWMYQGLNRGLHVIRLKIGDPFVFGRGGEEILKCRDFGVEPSVVPVRTREI